jgi:hypothetical protein
VLLTAIGYRHLMVSCDPPPVNAKAMVQIKAMASRDGQPCSRLSGDSGYPNPWLWGKKQSCRNTPHQKQTGETSHVTRRAVVSTIGGVVLTFTGLAAAGGEDRPPRFPKATMEQLNPEQQAVTFEVLKQSSAGRGGPYGMVSAVVIVGRIEIPNGGAPPMPVLVK